MSLIIHCKITLPIKPNKPKIELKISMTNILTNNVGSAASAKAALLPVIPTLTPHNKLQIPTVKPPQNNEKPV